MSIQEQNITKKELPAHNFISPSVARQTSSVLPFSKDFSKDFSNRDSRFVASTKYNPCPVCDGNNGSCRLQGELVHCHSYADARAKEVIGNYICVKPANGHTATFKELDPKFEARSIPRFAIQRSVTTIAGSTQETAELSLEERDQHYRRLLSLLELNEADRENLRQRGLSNSQIESGMFRSIFAYHKLDAAFPSRLPGIIPAGFEKSKIIATGDGILCPILQNGLVLGLELRLSQLNDGDKRGRYRLVSSKDKSPINIQGELPIPYIPTKTEQKQIYVAEGKGLKPNILALRHGVNVIGYARFMRKSPIQANRLLAPLDKDSKIVLCPDAGDVLNKSAYEGWIAEYEFYQSKGFKTSFAWWGQATKEDSDIDELDSLENIELIDLQAFQELIGENQAVATAIYVKEQKDIDWQNWLAIRKFTPDIVIDNDEQYFKFPKNLPVEKAIISLNAGMGTGKTEASLEEVSESEQALVDALTNEVLRAANKKGTIWIGYRNTLLAQSVQRASNKKISMTLIKGMATQDVHALLESNYQHLALCLDSIKKVDGYFEGRDIYIDESCSVLLHGINGGTLKDEQAEILAIFAKAMRECKRVFLMDGNQSDFFTGIVAKLAPEKKGIKIQKKSNYVPQNFVFVEGFDAEKQAVKPNDKSAMISMLTQIDGKLFGFSDSRKQTNILGRMFTKLGKQGNVLNQETVSEPWAKAFLSNPDKFIEETQPDFHINSPTADAGLSIDIKGYFEAKFSFFNGVLTTNSQRQALHRLRDTSLTHYIHCPERTSIRDPKIPFYFYAQKIQEALTERSTVSALLASHTANDHQSVRDIVLKKISDSIDNVFSDASFLIMAMENYERANLRKCLIHSLKEDGHNVQVTQIETSSDTKEKINENNIEILEEDAKNIFKAEPLDDDEYKRYVNESPNRETAYRVQKTKILKILPNIEKEDCFNEKFILEYWLNRNRQKIWQHDQFILFHNIELARKKHEANVDYVFRKQDFFLPGFIDYKPLRLETLHILNIEQFLDINKEWCKTDPQVIALYETIKNSEDLRKKLNYRLPVEQHNGQHFIATLKEILGWLGLKFKKPTHKLSSEGERLRYYQIDDEHFNSPERLAIIKSLEAKHIDWLLSDKSTIDWISDDKHSQILAEAFKQATSHEQVLKLEQEWSSKLINDPNKSESENRRHNEKIEKIVTNAWGLLNVEEEIKIKSLQPVENLSSLIKKVDNLILEKLPQYSLDLLYNQLPARLWSLRLEHALNFGTDNANNVYRSAEKALGAAIKNLQLSEKAVQIYKPIAEEEIIVEAGKSYHEVNHRLVEVKEEIVEKMQEITEANLLALALNCETMDDALTLTSEAYQVGKLGECLDAFSIGIRKRLLETDKYIQAELRKCYRSFWECFTQGIEMISY